MWSPAGAGVHYATGFGTSWTASTGIPAGAVVESDRVNPKTFYGFKAGTFYVSTDGGATFTASAATGLPAAGTCASRRCPARRATSGWRAARRRRVRPVALDGRRHDVHQAVRRHQADTIGFGKAAPGAAYQALYTIAKIGGVRGIFRSDDKGASWIAYQRRPHQWG